MRRLDAQGNLLSSSGGTLYGTHAAIPAASTVEPGTIYFESDTGVGYRSDGRPSRRAATRRAVGSTCPVSR